MFFELSDDAIIQRALGRRNNPLTSKTVHLSSTTTMGVDAATVENFDFNKLAPVTDPNYDEQQIQSRLSLYALHTKQLQEFYATRTAIRGVDASVPFEKTVESLTDILLWAADAQLREFAKLEEQHREQNQQIVAELQTAVAQIDKFIEADGRVKAEALADKTAAAEQQQLLAVAQAATPAKPKTPKGAKGKAPAEPEPSKDELEQKEKELAAQVPVIIVETAPETVEVTVAPPPIDTKVAESLNLLWTFAERSYLEQTIHAFKETRAERERILRFIHENRQAFVVFLQRPDSKQEFVTRWQAAFNALPNDLRDDDETKAELHKRAEDLKETLWDICDGRKLEAANEKSALLKEGWLEDHVSVLINLYISLVQAEVDRFLATQTVLDDYYAAYASSTPPERQREKFQLPVFDLTALPAVEELEVLRRVPPKSPAVAGRKGDKGGEDERVFVYDPKAPFIKRTDNSEDYDARVFSECVELALGLVQHRESPDEKRARLEQEVEAAKKAQEKVGGKKDEKKKDDKKRAQSAEVTEPVAPVDPVAVAAQQAKEALQAKLEREAYAALAAEDERFKARLRLIKNAALAFDFVRINEMLMLIFY